MKILQTVQIPQYLIVILIILLQSNVFSQANPKSPVREVIFEIPGTFDPFASRYAFELQKLCSDNNIQLLIRNFEVKTKTDTTFIVSINQMNVVFESELDSFFHVKPLNQSVAKKLFRFGIDLRKWYNEASFQFEIPDYSLQIHLNSESNDPLVYIGKKQLPNNTELRKILEKN